MSDEDRIMCSTGEDHDEIVDRCLMCKEVVEEYQGAVRTDNWVAHMLCVMQWQNDRLRRRGARWTK